MRNLLINSIYVGGTLAGYLDYKFHIKRAKKKQVRKLLALVTKNKDTEFGRQHHFDRITGVESFKKHVPIREYEDFEPYIHRIMEGETNVLTSEDIILFEPTGGTTSGSKLIPYTRSLKKEFQKAVKPWLFDIYSRGPHLLKGKSYWSITPTGSDKTYTPGGIPVGFEEDSEYLGLLGKILKHVLIAPNALNRVKNIENFRYVTAYFFLKEKDLSFISIWNPTFLILILETVETYLDALIADIQKGTLTLPVPETPEVCALLETGIKPAPRRAAELKEISGAGRPLQYTKIWKRLKFISCWTDSASRSYAEKLAGRFPGAVIQGKGLIATEGIVTIPFFKAGGCVPAYNSHFFEFLEEDTGDTKLLHRLEKGKEYTVVITTGGGLYRYNLKDKVIVRGHYAGMPLIVFQGRENVSDVVGEKLDCRHVRRVMESVLRRFDLDVDFIMLSPGIRSSGCYYTVFMEPKGTVGEAALQSFRDAVEAGLCENYYYKYGKELGQISPLRIFLIRSGGINAYFKRCTECGQRIGDIKPNMLDKRTDWENHFQGKFL